MKKIVIIVLAVAALGTFVMYQQQIINAVLKLVGMEEKKEVIKAVANLSQVNKNVTVKRAAKTVWGNAEMNEPLGILDSVSTGLESTATVKFLLGYLMNVGEKSLVVIDNPTQAAANLIEVTFDQGSLDAKTTETAAPGTTLRIRSNNTVTEVTGRSDFFMAVDKINKKAEIWIRLGEARVRDNKGHEIIIKENERKTLSTEEIMPEPEPVKEEILPPPPEPEKVVPKPKKKHERKLTRNDIIKAVSRQRKKIDACYERNRKMASGKNLGVKITIRNTGAVSAVDIVRSNLNDPTVERCVIFWVKAIKFPKFEGAPAKETINFAFQ